MVPGRFRRRRRPLGPAGAAASFIMPRFTPQEGGGEVWGSTVGCIGWVDHSIRGAPYHPRCLLGHLSHQSVVLRRGGAAAATWWGGDDGGAASFTLSTCRRGGGDVEVPYPLTVPRRRRRRRRG